MKSVRAVCIVIVLSAAAQVGAAVRSGLDEVGAHRELFAGKRVGIIANHTSCNSRGQFVVDVFRQMDDVKVVALFAPEHGLYGLKEAGREVASLKHPVYGIPVRSLYGETKKPTRRMLADVDVLVFDMQDVGARFYTYLYTMSLAMEAAAECGKPFVVLDRPNPINGLAVEGPVLEPEFASFVGLYPIPVRFGLTVGELARMVNGQGWLAGGVRAELVVVPMKGWRRAMWYDQTGLRFIKPSPNMPDLETAALYPGLCLLEGTNVSEGRGTPLPFRKFGAPWIRADDLVATLNRLCLPGVGFESTAFVPTASKHKGQKCHGVRIVVTDRTALRPFRTGVLIVKELRRMFPDAFEWRSAHFDRLCGTDAVRRAITAQSPLELLKDAWRTQCLAFEQNRGEYLLYGEN